MSRIETHEIERALFSLMGDPKLLVRPAGIEVDLPGCRHPLGLETVRKIVETRNLLGRLRERRIPTAWLFASLPARTRPDTMPLTDWDLEVAVTGAKYHESAMYLLELCREKNPAIGRITEGTALERLKGIWSMIGNRLAAETIRRSVSGFRLERRDGKVTVTWDTRPVFSVDFGEFVRDCALSSGFRESGIAETIREVFIDELFGGEIDLAGIIRHESSDPSCLWFEIEPPTQITSNDPEGGAGGETHSDTVCRK